MNTKYFLFFISIGLLFFMSCSPKLKPNITDNSAKKIYYPQDADTAYFQYLKGINFSGDIEMPSKFQEAIVGKKAIAQFIKPYGVTVFNNKVYVADIGIKGVNILDFKNKSFTQFAPFHRDLSFILTSAVDENGDQYLVDSKSLKVAVYDINGKFKTIFSVEENVRPVRIRIKQDKIYIADIPTGKINIYSKETYKLIDSFPKNVTNKDESFIFMAMDFDFDDKYIYVIDAGDFKVKIYTHDFKFVKSFGEQGNGYGMFNRPKSIAVDQEGNILVIDSVSKLIQVFNSKGQPLTIFGYPYPLDEKTVSPGLEVPTQMVVDYKNLEYFKTYVDTKKYKLKYLIFVANQQGDGLLKVYGRLERK